MKITIILLNAFLISSGAVAMSNPEKVRQVRTYMPYSVPVDPVKMVTIPDMDLSYALAGTMVEWDSQKQISSGVASKWETIGDKTYRFHIRKGLQWSDGSPVISAQIKQSFDRALKKYPSDLRSLGNLLFEIKCPNNESIDFVLKVKASESNLLGKLTEPNYGVLRLNPAGELNLSVTTGPFYISNQSESGLTLTRNAHWFKANSEMPEEVLIRRPGADFNSETILLKDSWANMIETSSMISAGTTEQYQKGNFQIWKRPFDKMGVFQLSRTRANSSGFALMRYLRKSMKKENLFKGLSGFEPTDQAFPRGYQLHDSKFNCDDSDAELPSEYKTRPVHIVLSAARIGAVLQANIESEIQRVTGLKPVINQIPLQDVGTVKKLGDYDFYAGTMGMADPDPEGIMSYYFEGESPMVPSSSENFVERLDHARTEQNHDKRIELMTAIMTDATCKGHVLPIYHVSTVGIGRPELDFKSVPITDESITLSKIRFKAATK
jgi:ABC-type transport system substrate-binding protein